MRALGYDLRLAVRSLTKTPGFTITAVAVLAIGLAICTAVFTVAEHVLMRPLPYPQADRLVMLWDAPRDAPDQHNVVAPGNIADWRAQSRSFIGIGVFNVGTLAIDRDGGRERIPGVVVPWICAEPLRGPIDISRYAAPECIDNGAFGDEEDEDGTLTHECDLCRDYNGLGWVVAGIPTDHLAGEDELDWILSVRDQCRSAGPK